MSVIPDSYETWVECIVVRCGLDLTPAFIAARIAALRDPADAMTRRLAEMWGDAYVQQLIAWFERAGEEATGASRGGDR